MFLAILNALAAIPQIAGYIQLFAAAVTDWYVKRQTAETQAAIVDALAKGLHAQTDDERYAAAQAWQAALARPRTTNS